MGAIADRISELENAIENENALQDILMDQHSETCVRKGQEFLEITELEDEISDLHFWEFSKKAQLRQRIEDCESQMEMLDINIEDLQNRIDASKERMHTFQNDLGQTVALLEEVGEDSDENGEIPLDDDVSARLDALFADDD